MCCKAVPCTVCVDDKAFAPLSLSLSFSLGPNYKSTHLTKANHSPSTFPCTWISSFNFVRKRARENRDRAIQMYSEIRSHLQLYDLQDTVCSCSLMWACLLTKNLFNQISIVSHTYTEMKSRWPRAMNYYYPSWRQTFERKKLTSQKKKAAR